MLTLSKPLSAAQAHSYHQREFSNSQDNYYTEGDRVRGQWHGRLAEQWGLSGEVDEQHFARLSDGQHPLAEAQLVRHHGGYEYANGQGETIHPMTHRAGWDATFSAPKSVSLTALVGGDERVRIAHRESVNIALDELEKHVQARIGGYAMPETTGKWAAAKFEHDSSRPVDGYAAPQLHTHVVIFNVTERANGDTRALQPQELYRSQQYATAIYRSELALRLQLLGYEIQQGPSGAPEIKGYSQEYLEASSPRRRQIQQHLSKEGLHGAEAAQIAAHRTRDAKLEISHSEMRRLHLELAERYDNQPQRVVQAASVRAREVEQLRPTHEQARAASAEAVHYAIAKSFEREAVTDERQLMREALKRAMGHAPLPVMAAEFSKAIQQGSLIEMPAAPGNVSREFTTAEMIHLEQDNIRVMQAGQGQFPALVSFAVRRDLDSSHAHLSNSQRGAIEEVLGSHDRILALEGVAGAGKTTSLSAVREAAERDGYQVKGFAPTSRAAHQLGEAGIESSTLQRHLAQKTERDGQRHFYILDESSLASTRQMNDFLRRLEPQDRVLLVGDVRQHEAVEAGRPYQQMQQAGMRTARLDEIVRQKDQALKEVITQLSAGRTQAAMQDLKRQGRVREIADREERFTAIARDYRRHPHGTLVVSPDNQSRRELNRLIHHQMQEHGQVGQGEYEVKVLEPRNELTGADRAWAGQYSAGDVLRYSRGSKRLGIGAGDYASVKHADGEVNLLTVERQDGKQIAYDPRRLQGVSVYRQATRKLAEGDRVQFTAPSPQLHVANRELGTMLRLNENGEIVIRTDTGRLVEFNVHDHPHLDYGYAVTSHSSQGQTADRVLVHVDTEQSRQLVNSRMAYVAISRGRYDAQIYTNDKEEIATALGREHTHSTALGTREHRQENNAEQGYEMLGHAGHDSGSERAGATQSHEQDASVGQGQGLGE